MRHCPLCDKDLPEGEFYRKKNGRFLTYCKTCQKDYVRWNKIRLKYPDLGITLEEVRTLKEQESCESCGREGLVFVDHDHSTGRFRGMLCRLCNSGIGFLGDTIEGVEAALRYLKRERV